MEPLKHLPPPELPARYRNTRPVTIEDNLPPAIILHLGQDMESMQLYMTAVRESRKTPRFDYIVVKADERGSGVTDLFIDKLLRVGPSVDERNLDTTILAHAAFSHGRRALKSIKKSASSERKMAKIVAGIPVNTSELTVDEDLKKYANDLSRWRRREALITFMEIRKGLSKENL